MALTYSFEGALDLDPVAALQWLAAELPVEQVDQAQLRGPALQITTLGSSELRQSVIADAFGFRPLLGLGFRIDSNAADDDYVAGKHLLIRATVALLREYAGAAVLLFNGETVLLQRLHEQITLNQAWREWTSYDLLREVTLPYELRPLPSPLL